MNPDDPFFQSKSNDRTVIRPKPGGRRADLQTHTSSPQPAQQSGDLPRLGNLNPIEAAASGILALLTRVNSSRSYPDPAGLKRQLVNEIKKFQDHAMRNGIDQKTIFTSRYVLCTTLDEAVLNTPWGNASGWAQQSLLNTFHKEVSGGEKFFQMLKSLGQNPSSNLHLLELMYLCLALGFEGRYRMIQGGKDKVQQIRSWLFQIIDRERATANQELSPHWKGIEKTQHPLTDYIPVWVYAAVAAGLLGLLFFSFLMHLNHKSDPVFNRILGAKVEIPDPPKYQPPKTIPLMPPPPKTVPITPVITLSDLLQPEIQANQVTVIESPRISTVTIQGDSLFRSGKANVNDSVTTLIRRIGESLDQLDGQVVVSGHSDSDPIRNARFPSNFHLSQARADSVGDLLKPYLRNPDRIIAEGRADSEPVDSNETRAGKARNRRVEIMLFK